MIQERWIWHEVILGPVKVRTYCSFMECSGDNNGY